MDMWKAYMAETKAWIPDAERKIARGDRTLVGIGGLLEVVGGGLMLVGLFTRPVAFVLSGMMAVAYFQFHAPGGFWPTVNGGVPAVLYCFVWLYFSAAGAGPWSLDAKRGK